MARERGRDRIKLSAAATAAEDDLDDDDDDDRLLAEMICGNDNSDGGGDDFGLDGKGGDRTATAALDLRICARAPTVLKNRYSKATKYEQRL